MKFIANKTNTTEIDISSNQLKQKFLKDIRKMAGQFKDQLFHSLDYFFELLLIALNILCSQDRKNKVEERDQKVMLIHYLQTDFPKFVEEIQILYAQQKKGIENPIQFKYTKLYEDEIYTYRGTKVVDSDDDEYASQVICRQGFQQENKKLEETVANRPDEDPVTPVKKTATVTVTQVSTTPKKEPIAQKAEEPKYRLKEQKPEVVQQTKMEIKPKYVRKEPIVTPQPVVVAPIVVPTPSASEWDLTVIYCPPFLLPLGVLKALQAKKNIQLMRKFNPKEVKSDIIIV